MNKRKIKSRRIAGSHTRASNQIVIITMGTGKYLQKYTT